MLSVNQKEMADRAKLARKIKAMFTVAKDINMLSPNVKRNVTDKIHKKKKRR